MTDYSQYIMTAIQNLEYLADMADKGDFSLLDYKHGYSEKYCDYDENGVNRRRLINVMIAKRNELIREDIVERLFSAEVESRRKDSFGGMGALETLSAMLWQFNDGGKYDKYFEDAKNANFDCSCEYETRNVYSYELGTERFGKMSPSECIECLYFDFGCFEEVVHCLDIYENEYGGDINALGKIRYMNEVFNRKSHNYAFLKKKLSEVLEDGNEWSISSAYSDVIESCIDSDPEEAYKLFKAAMPYLKTVEDWEIYGLGRNYMAYAAAFVLVFPQYADELWREWRGFILRHSDKLPHNDIQNYYLKAAKKMGDNGLAAALGQIISG